MFPFSKKKQVYQVEDIIDETVINNEPHYLIKWVGLPHECDTWEPVSSLGNIIDFLKFWLHQRKLKMSKSKERENRTDFDQVRSFVDREYHLPKRKSVRQQYADEEMEEKKRTSRQRFGEKILKQKKTWEKYWEYDKKHIDLVDQEDENEQHLDNQKSKMKEASQPDKMQQETQESEKYYIKNQKNADVQADNSQKPQQTKIQKQPEVIKPKQEVKPKEAVKVVDYIDPSKITKICKTFTFKGIKCVQVQCANGKRLNMKEDQLKLVQPVLLMEYYQNNNIPF